MCDLQFSSISYVDHLASVWIKNQDAVNAVLLSTNICGFFVSGTVQLNINKTEIQIEKCVFFNVGIHVP